jgi:molybdate transport system substrate-binding protein
MRHGLRNSLLVLLAPVTAGCASETPGAAPAVTVLAAASTAEAIEEVAQRFHDATGIEVRVSGGPSNALARQIESGAPADLFLSASVEWAEAVGPHAAATKPLLSNRLVLVVPKGNPAGVRTPEDLLSDRVGRVALAGEGVPAGRYADAALKSLGLSEKLGQDRIARGHDVRATLAFAERGEAEAGIVYATDAAASDRVEVVHMFDPSLHPPIVYPVVLLKAGPAGEAGRRFFEYVDTDEAQEVFRRHGFLPAGNAPADDAEPSP